MKDIIEKRKLNSGNVENNKLGLKKLESQLEQLVKGQEVNRQELQLGFIGLAKQNQELLYLNKELSDQLKKLSKNWIY